VKASKAEKAAYRPTGGDLLKYEQLGSELCFEATSNLANFQAIFVARRCGISQNLALAVAEQAPLIWSKQGWAAGTLALKARKAYDQGGDDE